MGFPKGSPCIILNESYSCMLDYFGLKKNSCSRSILIEYHQIEVSSNQNHQNWVSQHWFSPSLGLNLKLNLDYHSAVQMCDNFFEILWNHLDSDIFSFVTFLCCSNVKVMTNTTLTSKYIEPTNSIATHIQYQHQHTLFPSFCQHSQSVVIDICVALSQNILSRFQTDAKQFWQHFKHIIHGTGKRNISKWIKNVHLWNFQSKKSALSTIFIGKNFPKSLVSSGIKNSLLKFLGRHKTPVKPPVRCDIHPFLSWNWFEVVNIECSHRVQIKIDQKTSVWPPDSSFNSVKIASFGKNPVNFLVERHNDP